MLSASMRLGCPALVVILLIPRFVQAWQLSLSQHVRLELVSRLVHAHHGVEHPRQLGATDSATATSQTWHNGTAEERVINATWQCTYPEGKCFHNRAPLEGLPEKLEACVQEHNEDPLTVLMTIDLTCAGMTNTRCDDKMEARKFDPFYLCNNNPLLLTAECQMTCKDTRPFENCIFHFDAEGVYNMSDETVDICSLEAICMSPYIEQNQMLCSGHQTVGKFKPHWAQRALPDRERADHGIRAALNQHVQRSSFFKKAISVIALLLLFGSVVNLVLLRLGFFSDPQRFFDSVFGSARTLRISRLGGSYEAPQVFEFQPLDVPPLELACAKRPVIPLNEEWDSLNGAA